MQQRKLGSALSVSAIGLGCMGMSHAYGGQDEATSIATLRRAVDLGITFFDTAEVYGPFVNEELVGKALRDLRDEVVIATKFGFRINTDKSDAAAMSGLDGRPEQAKSVAEASLRRLGTDVIDLYYLHRVDPAVPIEDTVGAMADLVAEGKVKAIGLSEVTADELRRAHEIHPITAVQSEYSLWTRDPEMGVLAACRELGVGFVPFSPLGRGMLTGALTSTDALGPNDFRRGLPRFQGENFDLNRSLVAALDALAAEKGVTPAQLALAWVLNQGDDIVPIPGTRSEVRLAENIAAVDIVLSEPELAQIAAVFPAESVAGARYAPTAAPYVAR
ncbi:aldo/keto reductase [Methylobrevis albus]|uniref:Aldo/keto reductase n=1 Tax=Methylobrevis albus TaxID=2793297 RepID=A0A931I6G8_9HYPH|nr:aldo/keto reductase [Methylobrevis albus]MBH0239683.1 aldo/keto reductase [Methylobrevis albus]